MSSLNSKRSRPGQPDDDDDGDEITRTRGEDAFEPRRTPSPGSLSMPRTSPEGEPDSVSESRGEDAWTPSNAGLALRALTSPEQPSDPRGPVEPDPRGPVGPDESKVRGEDCWYGHTGRPASSGTAQRPGTLLGELYRRQRSRSPMITQTYEQG